MVLREEYQSSFRRTIAQAFSGYSIQNGDADQPMPASRIPADYFSDDRHDSRAGAPHKVRETGKGESIDIAMHEVMLRMGQYFMMGITTSTAAKSVHV